MTFLLQKGSGAILNTVKTKANPAMKTVYKFVSTGLGPRTPTDGSLGMRKLFSLPDPVLQKGFRGCCAVSQSFQGS